MLLPRYIVLIVQFLKLLNLPNIDMQKGLKSDGQN
jgi:hypothetical protein